MTTIIGFQTRKICPPKKNKFMPLFIILGVCIVLFLISYFTKKPAIKGGKVLQEETFILYYVEWCPHCKVVKPHWDKLEKDADLNHINIKKINCEENEEEVEKNNIEGFPTILHTRNGKVKPYEGQREYDDFKQYLLLNK
tara:strand:+ start:25 stop:444 length:420 start_codon:yes stop_codon:yes gene_type:complete